MDPFAGLKKAKGEYKVYDSHYEKIGKVDDLLVDAQDRVLYIGVKMGLFGTNSTLVPAEIIRVNDKRQLIEISEPADTIKNAPHFSDNLTAEQENHVRSYYGLEALFPSPEHDPQGPYVPGDDPRFAPDPRIDIIPGERVESRDDVRPASGSRSPIDVPLGDEPVPEFTPPESPKTVPQESREVRLKRTGSEASSGASADRWERERSESGVTVHRLRR